MVETLQCGVDKIDRTQHRRRQGVENRPLKGGDRRDARMLGGARLEIDACTPRLMQGVDGRTHHTREGSQGIEFAERRLRQARLDRRSEGLVIDWLGQAAGEACGELFEGHDLQAVAPLPRRGEPKLAHGEAAVRHNRMPKRLAHVSLQSTF